MSSWSPSGSGTPAPPPDTAPTASARATTPTTVNGLGRVTLDGTATDPEGDTLSYAWASPRGGTFDDASALDTTWTAPAKTDAAQDIVLTLTVTDDGAGRLTHAAEVHVRVRENQRPTASVSPGAASVDGGGEVMLRGTASDPDTTTLSYAWTSSGAGSFHDDAALDTTWTAPPKTNAAQDITLTLTVTDDGYVERAATVTVQVTVRGDQPPPRIITGIGGGGGPPPAPTPSDEDFEWTVSRDIEELDSGHDTPLGAWSDGVTLWIAQNGDGADDAVYAYDLVSGERVEEREFELDGTNRAPRGVWSGDGTVVWVSDSGQRRLFAHDLESGERLPERDLGLDTRNRAARGIWSDGETMWVLDGRADALFAYDLAGGELLAEYALHDDNDDPHGIWSDHVTVWVSNHDPKRLFAYRLPSPERPATEDADAVPLMRVRDEEFRELRRASNNSPRGIWSDGDVMYVADQSDDKVYSYNMPDAIDARLASLSLSGVEIGEFAPGRPDYEGVLGEGVTETTVEAEAAQGGAAVVIEPADADEDADGHQVALAGVAGITVTVTSEDGSRTRVYRVRLAEPAPAADCLRGAVAVGFSLVAYEGGSVEALEACAQSRHVTALHALHDGEYVSYSLGAQEFANRTFRELYPDGVPALTPLIARSEGPPSEAPAASEVTEPWPECLRGATAGGFSLVVYEGGSVDDLEACARSLDVAAVYALHEGEFVSYILGAPDFVNEAFVALFPEGLAPVTPLIARSD